MKFHLPFPRHSTTRYIRLNTGACQACWTCVSACPQQVLGKVDFRFHRHVHIDQAQNCRGCLRCFHTCPHQAILLKESTDDHLRTKPTK